MKITAVSLPGLLLIEPKVFGDNRGFFLESYRKDIFQKVRPNVEFVQDNHSRSSKGVLRGLHYQLDHPQGKLVRVSRGSVFDVSVDIRRNSETFGHWFGTILDEQSMKMMYIPPGFAHGFLVLSDIADFHYKCTDYYHPQSEQGLLWNDPDIDIKWPQMDVRLSEKDSLLPKLRDQAKNLLPKM